MRFLRIVRFCLNLGRQYMSACQTQTDTGPYNCILLVYPFERRPKRAFGHIDWHWHLSGNLCSAINYQSTMLCCRYLKNSFFCWSCQRILSLKVVPYRHTKTQIHTHHNFQPNFIHHLNCIHNRGRFLFFCNNPPFELLPEKTRI